MNPILTHRKNGKQLIRCIPSSSQGYVYLYLRCYNLWAYFPKTGEHKKIRNSGKAIFIPRLIAIVGCGFL